MDKGSNAWSLNMKVDGSNPPTSDQLLHSAATRLLKMMHIVISLVKEIKYKRINKNMRNGNFVVLVTEMFP